MTARESLVGIGRILFSSLSTLPSPSGTQRFSLSQWLLGLFPRPFVMLQRNRSDWVNILVAELNQAHTFQIL